jgi:hypothetical protein
MLAQSESCQFLFETFGKRWILLDIFKVEFIKDNPDLHLDGSSNLLFKGIISIKNFQKLMASIFVVCHS